MKYRLPSLTIFFPFFNDEKTVHTAVQLAFILGRFFTDDLEVIAIHGGDSHDTTWKEILKAKRKWPALKIINKVENSEGYAVIKYGFAAATKEWIFYTDGDLQYNLLEIIRLIRTQNKTNADIVNGYKTKRSDNLIRTVLGKIYQRLVKIIFQLPISDLDCDFRLIRAVNLKQVQLKQKNASVLLELILKLQKTGAVFKEVPVSHHDRVYGSSNYSWWQLTFEKIFGDSMLFTSLARNK